MLNGRMGVAGATRLAALELVDLPLECAFGAEVGAEALWAVRTELRGRRVLEAVSSAARRHRIRPGASESEARARCPDLEVRDRQFEREAAALRTAAELLMGFGPHVELGAAGQLVVEFGRSRAALGGLDDGQIARSMVLRLVRAGHRAGAVVADGPDPALTLLRSLAERLRDDRGEPALQIVPPGADRERLRELPLEALAWTDPLQDPDGARLARMREALAHLRWLGLRTVDDLTRFQGRDLPAGLAEVGHELLERAHGRTGRPMRTFRPPRRILERFEFDLGTEQLEPVLFVLRRTIHRIGLRLEGRGAACRALALTFSFEPSEAHAVEPERRRSSRCEHTVHRRFARATRDARWMFEIAKEGLELPGFVRWVELEALELERDGGAQLDLFTRHARRIEAAAQLVTRLEAQLGTDAVCAPGLVDTHRPESSWRPEPFEVDRALAELPVRSPKRPVLQLEPVPADNPRSRALPRVDEGLSVTGTSPEPVEEKAPAGDSSRPWPKPVPRSPDDEPPPPLAPRPTRLTPPRRIRWSETDGTLRLSWRERPLRVVHWGEEERLDTEWWTEDPLRRNYRIVQLEDGRCIWIYTDPQGQAYAHGVFD
jgi:protein ImuB